MKKIVLDKNSLSDVTVVSNYFLDEYMPKANGEYVKIYLYLLRCAGSSDIDFTIETLADKFDNTEKDVVRAITYWEQLGLLSVTYDEDKDISGISFKNVLPEVPISFKIVPEAVKVDSSNFENVKASVTEAAEAKASVKAEKKTKHTVSADKVAALTSNDDIRELLYIAQTYIGKTFTPTETNIILYFYDELGFSTELIEFLIEYCVSNNHKKLSYIETVALDWSEHNIETIEQAKDYVADMNNSFYPVLKAFGLTNRAPAAIEKSFILMWTKEYGFDMDIILDACTRTISTIHQPSFPYADSILQRWKKKNVQSLEDLKNIDEEHNKKSKASVSVAVTKNNSFNNFNQRTYDYDALERDLLKRR